MFQLRANEPTNSLASAAVILAKAMVRSPSAGAVLAIAAAVALVAAFRPGICGKVGDEVSVLGGGTSGSSAPAHHDSRPS